jgi:GntR family transcriptional regulator/MocR family aminotransferase
MTMQPTHISPDTLNLDLDGRSGPLTRRLMTALRDGIRDGSLPSGAVLPPSRALAAELGCSRWVVTETYGQLVAEGYLVSSTGSATRVRNLGIAEPGPVGRAVAPVGRPRFDLAPGIPDLRGFPRTRWADAYRKAVQSRQTDLLSDTSLLSTAAARAVITDHLQRTRQVREDPTQLSPTTGAAAAVGWLSRLFVALGHRRVAVEDPSWPGLRDAARRAGLELVPIEVDEAGLRVDQLDHHPGVRLVIITPAHQFPTGVPMSADRRLELINWAERVDGVIIEDDYDAEFRYDGRPVASLQGMAPDRVTLVGSVSKSMSPSVGVGWVIMPQWLIMRIVTDDLDRSIGVSPFAVDALKVMIENGSYERHLRAMRSRYRQRRRALLEAIEELLPDCRVSGIAAGLHMLLHLPPGTDTSRVIRRAARLELGVVDLDRYRIRSADDPALVIGYGNLRSGQERQAIALLKQALRGHP